MSYVFKKTSYVFLKTLRVFGESLRVFGKMHCVLKKSLRVFGESPKIFGCEIREKSGEVLFLRKRGWERIPVCKWFFGLKIRYCMV